MNLFCTERQAIGRVSLSHVSAVHFSLISQKRNSDISPLIDVRPTVDPNTSNASDDLPEGLKGLNKELIEKIQNEIVKSGDVSTFFFKQL